MEETKVICSACGAAVIVRGKSTRCLFCGSITTRPKPITNNSADAKLEELDFFVIPPTMSEADFDTCFKENVIEKDPDKIGDLGITEIFPVVFVRYSGTYSGSFTCMAGRERVNYVRRSNGEHSWNEKVVDIEYEPFQAQIAGNFVVDACVDVTLLEDVLSPPSDGVLFMQNSTAVQGFKKADIDDVANEFDLDSEEITHSIQQAIEHINDGTLFPNRVYPLIESEVHDAAFKQAPAPSENISATFSHTVNGTVAFVALFYARGYKQKDQDRMFLFDAGDGTYWGEADEPGFLELTGRAVSSLFSSMKRMISGSAAGVAAVPGLAVFLASKSATTPTSSVETPSVRPESGTVTNTPVNYTPSSSPNSVAEKIGLSRIEALEQLAGLRAKGILSDGEFIAAKKKILQQSDESKNSGEAILVQETKSDVMPPLTVDTPTFANDASSQRHNDMVKDIQAAIPTVEEMSPASSIVGPQGSHLSRIEALEQIAQLHTKGLLSDSDFKSAKDKILNRTTEKGNEIPKGERFSTKFDKDKQASVAAIELPDSFRDINSSEKTLSVVGAPQEGALSSMSASLEHASSVPISTSYDAEQAIVPAPEPLAAFAEEHSLSEIICNSPEQGPTSGAIPEQPTEIEADPIGPATFSAIETTDSEPLAETAPSDDFAIDAIAKATDELETSAITTRQVDDDMSSEIVTVETTLPAAASLVPPPVIDEAVQDTSLDRVGLVSTQDSLISNCENEADSNSRIPDPATACAESVTMPVENDVISSDPRLSCAQGDLPEISAEINASAKEIPISQLSNEIVSERVILPDDLSHAHKEVQQILFTRLEALEYLAQRLSLNTLNDIQLKEIKARIFGWTGQNLSQKLIDDWIGSVNPLGLSVGSLSTDPTQQLEESPQKELKTHNFSVLDELEHLAKARDQGLLSDNDLIAAKAILFKKVERK